VVVPSTNEFRCAVASTDVFSVLDGDALDDLAGRLTRVRVRAGDTLFSQGESALSLYVILEGRLRLTVSHADGRREVISELVRGSCVGATALVAGCAHKTTARAVRDVELLELTREEFDAVAARHPHQIMRVAQRLLAIESVPASPEKAPVSTLAVVPASADVRVDAFVRRLAERLSARRDVMALTSASATLWHHGSSSPVPRDGAFGPQSAGEPEQRDALLVYEADPVVSSWTEWALCHADRVLVVADTTASVCGPVERDLLSNRQRLPAHRDLILLHGNGNGIPTGTRRWLEHRHVDTHHHVCLDSDADVDRVARLVTGRGIGLLLSGGGARAFSHIGVIRAVQESGIPIDVVAGVSMGAVIGAQFALGWDPATMLKMNREGWIERKPLVDYTIPLMGLISGGRFTKMLAWMFGDTRIEDLRIPYFCTSASLSRAEPVVHWDGPLCRWLRASVSLPGIAPPLPDRGELLADGGLIANLPVDVMRVFFDGQIIASDAGVRARIEADPGHEDHPSAWKLLESRVNPFARAIGYPTLFDIMSRTVMLSATRAWEDTRRDVDVYVHPAVEEYGLFEWDAIDRIVDEGYRATLAQIGAWKQVLSA
jgi:predicted acylesterase/phospholipase RssA/CRP-like cAMP-binding protein